MSRYFKNGVFGIVWNPIEKLLKESGYTQKSLYTRENRTPIKTIKFFYQDISGEWFEESKEMIVYVTNFYASKIPDNVIVALNSRGERYLLDKEKELDKPFESLLLSYEPKYDMHFVPHILFKDELREGLSYIYK